ncbi:MAG: hypothetical protein AAB071_06435 [Bacteroidota bacterium]
MAKVKEPATLYAPKATVKKNAPFSSPKEAVSSVLKMMGDDVSYDEVMYEIYLLQKVERGLQEIEEHKTVPHEEAKKRLQKWLK